MKRSKRPLAIDLFSGAGGMSLGFEQAGFDVAAAFDADERNVETYNKNFPDSAAFQVDLSKKSAVKLRHLAKIDDRCIDVLFGGPPCQGFSVGGKRNLDDERNLLVYEFARLVREFKPKYFVLENVQGLMLEHAKPVVKSFLFRIRRAGYDVVEPIHTLSAADYGVPQRRKRAFILGFRQDLSPPTYPSRKGWVGEDGVEFFPTVKDAISDLSPIDACKELFDSDVYTGSLDEPSPYSKVLRGFKIDNDDESGKRDFSDDGLTGCLLTRHSPDIARRFAITDPGTAEPISRYYRLSWDSVAPTIRAGTGPDHGSHTAPRPIHPDSPRCITAREAARLHSFPDWFSFHATRWHAFRQIGNSVPPALARAVASSVREQL